MAHGPDEAVRGGERYYGRECDLGEGHEWAKKVRCLEVMPQAAYPRGLGWLTVEKR